MGMAVQMPALKKLGEDLGVSMEDGVAGLTNSLAGEPKTLAKETEPEDSATLEAPQDETAKLPPATAAE